MRNTSRLTAAAIRCGYIGITCALIAACTEPKKTCRLVDVRVLDSTHVNYIEFNGVKYAPDTVQFTHIERQQVCP